MANFINLLGQQFGRLTVTGRSPTTEHKHRLAYWLCRCCCGRDVTVRSDDLRNGRMYSCRERACRRNFQMRAVFNVVYDGSTRFGNGS
jgi:hypothetical protein